MPFQAVLPSLGASEVGSARADVREAAEGDVIGGRATVQCFRSRVRSVDERQRVRTREREREGVRGQERWCVVAKQRLITKSPSIMLVVPCLPSRPGSLSLSISLSHTHTHIHVITQGLHFHFNSSVKGNKRMEALRIWKRGPETVTRLQLCGILLFYLMAGIRMQSTQLQIQSPKTSLTDCAEIYGAFYSSSRTRFYTICVEIDSSVTEVLQRFPLGTDPQLTATHVAPWQIATGTGRTIKGDKFSWPLWVCGKWKVAGLFCNS